MYVAFKEGPRVDIIYDQPAGFTNRVEKVAIIGAGGSIGRHLTDQLLKNGKHTITLLKGQQVLLITMNVMAPRDTVVKIIRAAVKAGVRYIEPNWYGHDAANDALCKDSMLAESRDCAIEEIKKLGVSAYLLLVCNFWYEFSLGGGTDRFGFNFAKRTFTIFDIGDVVINTTTWPQCGREIASLLSLKELPEDENDTSPTVSHFTHRGTYVSSFRLTQRDMFETEWSITRESSLVRFKEGQEELKVHDWKALPKMLYSRMFFPNGDGDYESRLGLDNAVLGLPVERLDGATKEGIRMGWRVKCLSPIEN
ncbi:uncharacterized protein BDW70DRAFT_152590 [Aspergillus foveolatus]|uniref:uncharacterized protein n=1 Tax=Aspergillus foveolatus TaxID=210207 RepID=UPI003CCCCEB1